MTINMAETYALCAAVQMIFTFLKQKQSQPRVDGDNSQVDMFDFEVVSDSMTSLSKVQRFKNLMKSTRTQHK